MMRECTKCSWTGEEDEVKIYTDGVSKGIKESFIRCPVCYNLAVSVKEYGKVKDAGVLDVNNDGVVDARDATAFVKKVFGRSKKKRGRG